LLAGVGTAFAQFPAPISFSGPQTYTVGSYPRSVATGNFNGDGKLDLAVAVGVAAVAVQCLTSEHLPGPTR
jgi:hypothetical protein